MIVAVLGGTLASLQAAIVSSGRISFAMGRDRVFPKFFDNVHPRYLHARGTPPSCSACSTSSSCGARRCSIDQQRPRQHRQHAGPDGGDLLLPDRVHGDLVLPQGDHAERRQPDPGRHPARRSAPPSWRSSSSTRWPPASSPATNLIFGFGLALVGLILSFISAAWATRKFYSDPSTSFGDKVDRRGEARQRRGAMTPRAWIGLDLGTSALKAVALDADGRALAEAREAYDTARPGPGRAEQRATDWTAAAQAALQALAAAVPPAEWGGHRAVGHDPHARDARRGRAAGRPRPHLGGLPRRTTEAEEIAGRARPGQALREHRPAPRRPLPGAHGGLARAARAAAPRAHRARGRRQRLPLRLAHRRGAHRPQHGHRLRLLRLAQRHLAAARGVAGGRRGQAAAGRACRACRRSCRQPRRGP